MKHIQANSTDTTLQLGTYFTQTGHKRMLLPRSITNALRVAVKALQLHKVHITASQVSSHSLRAGGATAMHINGVPEVTIQKWADGAQTLSSYTSEINCFTSKQTLQLL